jgi:DNA-binding XRE family transcriptional regulator
MKDSTLATEIRSLRERLRLTQSAMAARIDVNPASIYRYEAAKSIPTEATLILFYDLAREVGHQSGIATFGNALADRRGTDLSARKSRAAQSKILTGQFCDRFGILKTQGGAASAVDTPPQDPGRKYSLFIGAGCSVNSNHSSIPTRVSVLLTQAASCFETNLFAASLLTSVQAIEVSVWYAASSKDPQRSDLPLNFDHLLEATVGDRRFREWGAGVLAIRDRASHPSSDISAEDAQDALRFADRLADYLYVLPADFLDFMKRRQSPHRGANLRN